MPFSYQGTRQHKLKGAAELRLCLVDCRNIMTCHNDKHYLKLMQPSLH